MNLLLPLSSHRQKIVARIIKTVRLGKTFFLTGHERPDGDTVGSELAMASYLRNLGKKVVVANVGPVPGTYMFLSGARRVKTTPRIKGTFDVAMVFECSGPDRTGHIMDFKQQVKTTINIDHHRHHGNFGDINLVDPEASSNSEQLCQIFSQAGHRLTNDEATALYVGLVTDTGRFQQENTRTASHCVAAHLIQAGVDVAAVYRHVYGTRSVAALKLMSRALGSLALHLDERVAVIRLTRNDFEVTGAQDDDTEDIPNQGLLPSSVWASVFLRERPGGEIKVSLRGKNRVDLCALAVSMGGGGHRNASGVTLAGTMADVERKILRALSLELPALR